MANLFKDTIHSSYYAKFRPKPPEEIINAVIYYLREKIPLNQWSLAVDVGCGSGQCTRPLAKHFQRVYGFDTSLSQIAEAVADKPSNVSYSVSEAELLPGVDNGSTQLVTACQAVHWFDRNRYFQEVKRVLAPNGVMALLGYRMPDTSHRDFVNNDRVKNLVKNMYTNPLLMWAKEERVLVDEGLASIEIPFEDEMRADGYETVIDATAQEVRGYLLSWSGFNTLKTIDEKKAHKFLNAFDVEVRDLFGDQSLDNIDLKLHFNYYLIMGRKTGN